MGKTVDEVMAELSVDLVEFKSRSKYLRVKWSVFYLDSKLLILN
jgi:hypothetical protein